MGMKSTPHQHPASTDDVAATEKFARHAIRAVSVACATAAPLQTTAAAPFWRALNDESAIWLLMPLSRRR
jgi:hypothetical protein